MASKIEDLNYDFNYNMFLAKNALSNLAQCEDRQRVIRWMRKLSSSNRSMDEMKLRNDFMYYLINNIQHGVMEAPFNENPPNSPLPNIAHLLPGGSGAKDDLMAGLEDDVEGDSRMPMLYANSPDGGAFLAAQPVPRCGAFCYLAVVARPRKD